MCFIMSSLLFYFWSFSILISCGTCLKDFWGVSGSGRYGSYLLTLTELHLANILKHANLEELEKDLNSFLFVDLGRMVPVQDNVDSFQVKMNILSKYYLFMPKVLSMMQNMVWCLFSTWKPWIKTLTASKIQRFEWSCSPWCTNQASTGVRIAKFSTL